MTVGELLKHLNQFHHDLQQFKHRLSNQPQAGQAEVPATPSTEWQSFQTTLREHYHHLKEHLSNWSEACLSINLENGRAIDLYESIFSDPFNEKHLDWIKADLEQIISALSTHPPDQLLPTALRHHQLAAKSPFSAFGSLGHHGQTREGPSPLTLQDVFQAIGTLLREQVSQPEDLETLQAHVQALLTHPAMAEVLAQPFPLHPSTPFH